MCTEKTKCRKFETNIPRKGISGPQSQFPHSYVCERIIYVFPRWVCQFCWRKYVDLSWEYINRSKTHECGNWGWGRAIPRKGIYKRNCHCSVVCCMTTVECTCSFCQPQSSASGLNIADMRQILQSFYLHVKNLRPSDLRLTWAGPLSAVSLSLCAYSNIQLHYMPRCYWSEESYPSFFGHHQRYVW